MKEFKGTGGNWILKQQGDANEYCIVTDDMKWVSAFKLNGEQSKEIQLANMNLFTAAPELLKASISALRFIQKTGINYDNAEIYNEINKAINKALGK